MKILFISDIHGMAYNLKYVEELDKKNNFDLIVVLGDVYYTGREADYFKKDNKLVQDFLTKRKDKLICLRGNCDSNEIVDNSNFPFYEGVYYLSVDNLNIYLTHGHLYNKDNHNLVNGDILIYGHEHYPSIEFKNDITFINVGSLSLPRGGSKHSYGIYEDNKFTIYDIEGNIIDDIKVIVDK